MKRQEINRLQAILLIVFLIMNSCSKFLEVEPKNYVSDEITITDAASAQTSVRGIYDALASSGYYGRSFQSIGYLSGDNLQFTGTVVYNQQFIIHNVQSDNGTISSVWTAIYKAIDRANHAIEKIPAITDPKLTSTLKDQLIGEAYFIRALAYFDLARVYGGVQLLTKPTSSLENITETKRSSLEETYNQVKSDLENAENLLPNTLNRVRATKKTAWALFARYYLYTKEWDKASSYATQLIEETTNYPLIAPYNSWFANNIVASPESIFELSYDPAFITGNSAHRNSWQPTENGGIKDWIPNEDFLQLINNPLIGGNRNTLVAKTASTWYGNLYYRSNGTDPAYVLRIAEQYLIRAEAFAEQGNLEAAYEDLNAIRNRAGLEAIGYKASSTTKETTLLAIENERRLEFAFEPHRWFDLVRTGRAATVLGITDTKKYLMPIPLVEIKVDKWLEQNPGY
ncbi:RagB/SusD domain-containing protein [bacterium A37T11]|nr:RagB/SusD domain-containing protein [bacterium A37T11]